MSRQRDEVQSEAMRRRILDAASEIIAQAGTDALSIRCITQSIGYSPGIVYHYFHDKDEILRALLLEGYARILASIQPPTEGLSPREAVRAGFVGYMRGVLSWAGEYRAAMLSSDPKVLAVTSVLDADVREKRPAFAQLIGQLEAGIGAREFAPCDPRITAQTLWCSMFGLVMRIIIEAPISEDEQAALIERQADLMMKGLMA